MFVRLVVPLLLWAAFYIFVSWIQARAERREQQAEDEAERPPEAPDTEPPQELPAAA